MIVLIPFSHHLVLKELGNQTVQLPLLEYACLCRLTAKQNSSHLIRHLLVHILCALHPLDLSYHRNAGEDFNVVKAHFPSAHYQENPPLQLLSSLVWLVAALEMHVLGSFAALPTRAMNSPLKQKMSLAARLWQPLISYAQRVAPL